MKDEEINSGIYRDKKGMYMKLSKKDLKAVNKNGIL